MPSSASSSSFDMSNSGNVNVSGPTLPPDWQWICCDQDHGSSSRAPSDNNAGVSSINGTVNGDMLVNGTASPSLPIPSTQSHYQHLPQNPAHHQHTRTPLLSYPRRKSERGTFLSPLSISGSETRKGERGPMDGPVTAGAGLGPGLGSNSTTGSNSAPRSPIGTGQGKRGGHRSVRSLDPGLGRLHPRNHPLPQPNTPAQQQLQYLHHLHQQHHRQYPQQLDHQHPNNHGQAGKWTPAGYVTPNMTGSSTGEKSASARSNPSSRASTPGLPRDHVRSGSAFYPTTGADSNLTSVQEHLNPDPSGMTAPFSEAQLAQFMTYCCDKDDCVDPFPPPSTTVPALGESEQGVNNKHDEPYMDHVMFQAMFPHSGPGGLTPNSTPVPCNLDPGECDALGMDPAYCCGGGPDCHEPVVDSIGCEGHPRQCGLPECCAGEARGLGGMDVFMKGVDWEPLDASHGYVSRGRP